ncbi:alpha/beta fold hydrolase [Streptomyces sp. SP18CS02]|uniref:alpha/beta fold hydrolase n=1 Tax=Streptomyces sp. SP18CS02 TaxID=3002531 RepID=UPI002E77E553|nr:alpha/beta hydrolase [Streptomyces sp. SP18CS02]MEE1752962.1 alpha/beta hydrolase [Streptomyces sp. SP18CS02]
MNEASISRTAAPAPPYDTFASGDGLLAYRDAGPRDGSPLVLLHSGFVDHTQFDNLIPGLVAEGHRVITPDARGHGFSANATRPFRQADDLAALLRHLGLDGPSTLVGVSMGALIAVDTAIEHPELVGALVVSGRGIGEPDLGDPWSAALQRAQTDALTTGDIPGWLDGFVQWAAGPSRTLADIDQDIIRHIREMASRTLMKHTPDEPDHCVPVEDVAARAKDITVPVLAVDGALDAPGVLRTVTALMDIVPDGRSARLEGAGHYTTMEQPEAFTRILMDFLHEVRVQGVSERPS